MMHRLSTVRDADTIVAIADGCVDVGSHAIDGREELLPRRPLSQLRGDAAPAEVT